MRSNRVVAILTPLVFAPAAGFVTAWAAEHLPGLPRSTPPRSPRASLAAQPIAYAKAALWMRGWHLHMQSPDGRIGTPDDDDNQLAPLVSADLTEQHPAGVYDPDADLTMQPHVERTGHDAGVRASRVCSPMRS